MPVHTVWLNRLSFYTTMWPRKVFSSPNVVVNQDFNTFAIRLRYFLFNNADFISLLEQTKQQIDTMCPIFELMLEIHNKSVHRANVMGNTTLLHNLKCQFIRPRHH